MISFLDQLIINSYDQCIEIELSIVYKLAQFFDFFGVHGKNREVTFCHVAPMAGVQSRPRQVGSGRSTITRPRPRRTI